MKWLMIVVLLLRTVNSVACDYESNDEIIFQGSIESVKIEKQTTENLINNIYQDLLIKLSANLL